MLLSAVFIHFCQTSRYVRGIRSLVVIHLLRKDEMTSVILHVVAV